MSVYIKKMEMPQNCYECKFGLATFYRLYTQDSKGKANCYSCVLTGKQITSTKRNIHCPLVPIPPHGRLIEDVAVREQIDEWLDSVGYVVVGHGLSYYGELLGCIEDAPTIIPAEEADA